MAIMAVGAVVSAAVETTVIAGVTMAIGASVSAAVVLGVSSVITGVIAMAAGQMIGGAINSAIGLGGSSSSPAASAVGSSAARGMLINAASSIDPLRVIYGSRKVGGNYVMPPSVSGANNEYLHLVIALCEGPISAINTVYLDGVPTTDARFTGLVTVEKYLGTDTQTASAALIAAMPGVWTAAHQGKGVAYLIVTLKADPNAFHGLSTITADIDGKLVYDPRDLAIKFSNNNALCIRDYLTSTRYGRGIATTDLDDAAIIVAANHCEDLVTIPGPATQVRYTCDGIINIDDTVYANMQRLLGSCRGMLVFSGGKYKLVIDKAETPSTFTFNEDNITGAWEIIRPGKRDMLNKITASFFNPDNQWQPDFSIQDSTAYRTLDHGLMLESKLDLPFTANAYRAGHLAQLAMKAARFGTVVRFSAFQEGLRCEVGDVVPITHSTPGWIDKPFRILTIDILDADNVSIMAKEYDASTYTLDALTALPTALQTTLPDMFTVIAPTGLSVAVENINQPDGTILPRLVASWTASTDAHLVNYDIAWNENAGPWDTTSTMATRWVIPASVTGRTYDVRVRAVNAMGIRSGWLTLAGTVATPPTVGPAAPTFTATGVPFAVDFAWTFGDARQDVAGTEVWWSSTNDRVLASMLSFVPFPSREYRHQPLAAGQGGYYWLRVADTFSNVSAWYPTSSTAGIHALASTDATALLAQLNSAVSLTQLAPDIAGGFVVGAVNGVTTVGLNGNQIIDGSLLARSISVTSLSAVSANLGTITSGTITQGTSDYIKGGATSYSAGTGYWMGYDAGAYKLRIGNPAGQGMTFDGANLNITGSLTASAVNAVNTINLAGNAVTIPVSVSATNEVAGPYPGIPTNVLSCSITSTGSPIAIIASCALRNTTATIGSMTAQLYRDGASIGGAFFLAANSSAIAVFTRTDTPGVGTFAYSIVVTAGSGSSYYGARGINLMETKR